LGGLGLGPAEGPNKRFVIHSGDTRQTGTTQNLVPAWAYEFTPGGARKKVSTLGCHRPVSCFLLRKIARLGPGHDQFPGRPVLTRRHTKRDGAVGHQTPQRRPTRIRLFAFFQRQRGGERRKKKQGPLFACVPEPREEGKAGGGRAQPVGRDPSRARAGGRGGTQDNVFLMFLSPTHTAMGGQRGYQGTGGRDPLPQKAKRGGPGFSPGRERTSRAGPGHLCFRGPPDTEKN